MLNEPAIRELIKRVRLGDGQAHEALARHYFGFIKRTCGSIAFRKGIDPDDAVQEALLIIPKAAADFDLRRKTEFQVYLWHKIRGALTTFQRRQQRQTITMDWWRSDADWFKHAPEPKLRDKRSLQFPVSQFWPVQARSFVKNFPRRNDRLIAKWLWLDYPPKRQSEIARKLNISRSAVTQRKIYLRQYKVTKFPDNTLTLSDFLN